MNPGEGGRTPYSKTPCTWLRQGEAWKDLFYRLKAVRWKGVLLRQGVSRFFHSNLDQYSLKIIWFFLRNHGREGFG